MNDLFSHLAARAAGELPAVRPLPHARFEPVEPGAGFDTVEEEPLAVAPTPLEEPVRGVPPPVFEVRSPTPPPPAPAVGITALPAPQLERPAPVPLPPEAIPSQPEERHTRELRTILEQAIEIAPGPPKEARLPLPLAPGSRPAAVPIIRAAAEPLPARDAAPESAPQIQTRPIAPSVTIKIGKIEVKGSAQPPPRPAPRPAFTRPATRVSVSLQDYLSKRSK